MISVEFICITKHFHFLQSLWFHRVPRCDMLVMLLLSCSICGPPIHSMNTRETWITEAVYGLCVIFGQVARAGYSLDDLSHRCLCIHRISVIERLGRFFFVKEAFFWRVDATLWISQARARRQYVVFRWLSYLKSAWMQLSLRRKAAWDVNWMRSNDGTLCHG